MSLERIPKWCAEAEQGLAGTLGRDATAAREGVNGGRLELWKVNGDSWLVTGIDGDTLVLWAYRGRDASGMVRAMLASARASNLKRVSFYTRRRALCRLLREFEFAEEETLFTATVR